MTTVDKNDGIVATHKGIASVSCCSKQPFRMFGTFTRLYPLSPSRQVTLPGKSWVGPNREPRRASIPVKLDSQRQELSIDFGPSNWKALKCFVKGSVEFCQRTNLLIYMPQKCSRPNKLDGLFGWSKWRIRDPTTGQSLVFGLGCVYIHYIYIYYSLIIITVFFSFNFMYAFFQLVIPFL